MILRGGPRARRRQEEISVQPWEAAAPPGRILVMRLHAIGDVAITLPGCVALRKTYPGVRLDFLTGSRSRELPSALSVFDKVYTIPDAATGWERAFHALRAGAALSKERYDLVVDLQRNWMTRYIRRICLPDAWSEFDRFSELSASERVGRTFLASGLPPLDPVYEMPLTEPLARRGEERLKAHGWDGALPLVCLNPAGLWRTRNWPLENYVELARAWLEREPACFILLGDGRIGAQAARLAREIPGPVINLAGQTSLGEAFAIVQRLSLIVSEDSGLMHMAWISGRPTLALFGSSNHVWSAPSGPHTRALHAGDLECGACMSPECMYGDVRCLSRYGPGDVLEAAWALRDRS